MNSEVVMVTGAGGMLGTAICHELLSQGYKVKAICLDETQSENLKKQGIELLYGNVLDLPFIIKAAEGCDFVIHVAALLAVWPNRSKILCEVNIQGTKNVMEAVKKNGLKRMVNIGSASSFGKINDLEAADETCEFKGWYFGLDYIESKYQAQEILIDAYKKEKFPVIVVNPTFMIGPFDSGPSSGKMLLSFYKDELPAMSKGGKNFVYSVDVAVAAVNALKMGRLGECYIAGHQNLTYKDFFSLAAEVTGKKLKAVEMPRPMVLLAGAFSNVWSKVSGTAPKLSYTMARIANSHQYYNPAKAVKELKMPQTPLRVGITECLSYFKTKGYI